MGAAQASLKAEAEATGSGGAATDGEGYNARVISSTDEDFRLRYRLQRTIGDGTSASVHRALNMESKKQVAVKVIQKKMLERDSASRVANELKAWRQLKHPHICQLYEVYNTPSSFYFVCELAENGDLLEFINNHGFFKEKQARRLFTQVLSAVEHCHAHGIVHRDMKLENILIDKDGNAKLTDFGFAGFFDPDSDNRLHEWCGSPPYAAPEIFLGSPYYGPEIDVWSLGVVLFAMCTGTLPFLGDTFELLMKQVLEGRFEVPFFMSMGCENLIRKMMRLENKDRVTIAQVKAHTWLSGGEASKTPPHKPLLAKSVATVTATAIAAKGATTGARTSPPTSYRSTAQDVVEPRRRNLFEAFEAWNASASLSEASEAVTAAAAASVPITEAERATPDVPQQSLMLFECAQCEAPESATWDFRSQSCGICTDCTDAKYAKLLAATSSTPVVAVRPVMRALLQT